MRDLGFVTFFKGLIAAGRPSFRHCRRSGVDGDFLIQLPGVILKIGDVFGVFSEKCGKFETNDPGEPCDLSDDLCDFSIPLPRCPLQIGPISSN